MLPVVEAECVHVGWGQNDEKFDCANPDEHYPDENFCCYVNPYIEEEAGYDDREAYAKFEFDFLLEETQITSVIFGFEFQADDDTYDDGYFNIRACNEPFDPYTITWNNKPSGTLIYESSKVDPDEIVIDTITDVSAVSLGFHDNSAYYRFYGEYDGDEEMQGELKCASNRQSYLKVCYEGNPIYCVSGACCDVNTGQYKVAGTPCSSAQTPVCDTHTVTTCNGHAYQDLCSGDSNTCPDNNILIDYDAACTGYDAGTCAVCNGGSTPIFEPEHTDCPWIDCNSLDDECRDYTNVRLCLDINTCASSPEYCTVYSDAPEGTPCGDNGACNGYGLCVENEMEYEFYYDANGNILKDQQNTYEYNAYNQLVKVRDWANGDRLIEQYSYDDAGNRIKKVEYFTDGSNQTTIYIDSNFVRIINSSGTFDTVYYYDSYSLVGERKPSGEMVYYHPDHLGSTSLTTNQAGQKIEETKYGPFGELLEGGNSRYTFTGQEADVATGLMYYGARYYSPTIKHFTQPDSVIAESYNPQNLNRYSYTLNNPVKYRDEEGAWVNIALGAGIGAAIGAGSSMIAQIANGATFSTMNWADVSKGALIGGVSGAIGGATFGLSLGATSLGAATYGQAFGAGALSGVVGGRAGQLTSNILYEQELSNNMLNWQDIAVEGLLGGVFGAGAKGLSDAVAQRGYLGNGKISSIKGKFPSDPGELTKMAGVKPQVKGNFNQRLVWQLSENKKIEYHSGHSFRPGDNFDVRHHTGHYTVYIRKTGINANGQEFSRWVKIQQSGVESAPWNYLPGEWMP